MRAAVAKPSSKMRHVFAATSLVGLSLVGAMALAADGGEPASKAPSRPKEAPWVVTPAQATPAAQEGTFGGEFDGPVMACSVSFQECCLGLVPPDCQKYCYYNWMLSTCKNGAAYCEAMPGSVGVKPTEWYGKVHPSFRYFKDGLYYGQKMSCNTQ